MFANFVWGGKRYCIIEINPEGIVGSTRGVDGRDYLQITNGNLEDSMMVMKLIEKIYTKDDEWYNSYVK